jgi:hypothetical protein
MTPSWDVYISSGNFIAAMHLYRGAFQLYLRGNIMVHFNLLHDSVMHSPYLLHHALCTASAC